MLKNSTQPIAQFINTRPRERAGALTAFFLQHSIAVYELPLLALEPLVLTDTETSYQQCLIGKEIEGKSYHAVGVISATAAEMGLLSCGKNFIPNCPVIAVGAKTAQVLTQVGWQVVCPTESSNEGMMQLPELATLKAGNRVLIWRGQGGRQLLSDDLIKRGVQVDSIAWYERQCPHDLPETLATLFNQLNPQRQTFLLISSGEAYGHWQTVMNQRSEENEASEPHPHAWQLTDFVYLTLGERLSNRLRQVGLDVVQIDNLNPQTVLKGIKFG